MPLWVLLRERQDQSEHLPLSCKLRFQSFDGDSRSVRPVGFLEADASCAVLCLGGGEAFKLELLDELDPGE